MAATLIPRPTTGWQVQGITTHPGSILRYDFLVPLNLSAKQVAIGTHMSPSRIGEIIHGRRSVSPDTALRLARFFGTSAEFWVNLQSAYDLSKTRIECGIAIQSEVELYRPLNA